MTVSMTVHGCPVTKELYQQHCSSRDLNMQCNYTRMLVGLAISVFSLLDNYQVAKLVFTVIGQLVRTCRVRVYCTALHCTLHAVKVHIREISITSLEALLISNSPLGSPRVKFVIAWLLYIL